MGWSEEALKDAGFRSQGDGVLFEDLSEYQRTWVGYTAQGVQTDGLIEIRLDAREGRVVSFLCHAGVGDVPVDLAAAIPQSRAEAIARAEIERTASQEGTASAAGYTLKQSLLKLTKAPALTGGETKLVWVMQLIGKDASGAPVGGTVYIDALSGQVLQHLGF